jgi:hypothetical protein
MREFRVLQIVEDPWSVKPLWVRLVVASPVTRAGQTAVSQYCLSQKVWW